jgi:hypothetical protein
MVSAASCGGCLRVEEEGIDAVGIGGNEGGDGIVTDRIPAVLPLRSRRRTTQCSWIRAS